MWWMREEEEEEEEERENLSGAWAFLEGPHSLLQDTEEGATLAFPGQSRA